MDTYNDELTHYGVLGRYQKARKIVGIILKKEFKCKNT